MAFLIDASLPREAFELLLIFGFDVVDARTLGLGDAPLDAVRDVAREQERHVLTALWDHPDPPDLSGTGSTGMMAFQLGSDLDDETVATRVLEFMQAYCNETWQERAAVIRPDGLLIVPPVGSRSGVQPR